MRSPFRPRREALALAALLAACGGAAPRVVPSPPAAPAAYAAPYAPERDLGPLFHAAQVAGAFPDSKTLVDARPRTAPSTIVARWEAQRGRPGFDLRAFLARELELPAPVSVELPAGAGRTMEAQVERLWPLLTRSPDRADPRSSLLPLPHRYVVPGGRFREVYYWDSYFTMLGLVESGRLDLVRDVLDNFAHLVRTVGHVPNGNRSYYLGRSQPPYFAAMVGLYAAAADTGGALRWLDALEREHAFWMDGAARLRPGEAHRRVVRLADGALLNRHWDDLPGPRPESYREDEALARALPPEARAALHRNLRAGAESGWDYSSRWMRDARDLRTLEVVELVPVDLNALLWVSERTIAALRRARGRGGDAAVAARFEAAAASRRDALLRASWDPAGRYFHDVRWRTGARVTDRPTLAPAALLWAGLVDSAHAHDVVRRWERDFLRPGGLVTTLVRSGQQWDAPNGWPPLQWLAVDGAARYGHRAFADTVRTRWLALNRRVHRATGRMMEKYDVEDTTRLAGGGEYPTQDGFGWTNGVALRLGAARRGPR